jgi:hypothetical protein
VQNWPENPLFRWGAHSAIRSVDGDPAALLEINSGLSCQLCQGIDIWHIDPASAALIRKAENTRVGKAATAQVITGL